MVNMPENQRVNMSTTLASPPALPLAQILAEVQKTSTPRHVQEDMRVFRSHQIPSHVIARSEETLGDGCARAEEKGATVKIC